MPPFSVLLSSLALLLAQAPAAPAKLGWCDRTGPCPLGASNPVHFDPYFNGHLCENFDPAKADYSGVYEELRLKACSKWTDRVGEVGGLDFSSVWVSGDAAEYGVLGTIYRRIRVHVERVVKKSAGGRVYEVVGSTKTGRNVAGFRGTIEVSHLFWTECDDPAEKGCGEVFARYEFREDTATAHHGVFRGVMEAAVVRKGRGRSVGLDSSNSSADGYWNRSYVGTWTESGTVRVQKCIWGDNRLPFTFDFDRGDGDMMVNDKYSMNGWDEFNARVEWIEVEKGKFEPKDPWWRSVK
jgi:hypothetical protein